MSFTMTYIDPKVYNYKNLKDKDKDTFDNMVYFCYEQIEHEINEIEFNAEYENTVQARMNAEIQKEALINLSDRMQSSLVDYLIYTIEHYEEDITSNDSEHYFDGCRFFEEDEEESE